MAIARGTAIVSIVRGRLGDNVFRVCQGKQIVSVAPATVTNPNTVKQQWVRNTISLFSQSWLTFLSAQQRADWETFALRYQANWNHPNGWRTLWDVSKDKRTGKDCYVMQNLYKTFAFVVPGFDAPLVATPPTCIIDPAGSYNPATNILTLTWSNPDEFVAGARVLWKIQSQQKHFHKQLIRGLVVTTGTHNLTQVTGAGGAVVLFANIEDSWIYLQAVTINPDGLRSAPGETILVQLA